MITSGMTIILLEAASHEKKKPDVFEKNRWRSVFVGSFGLCAILYVAVQDVPEWCGILPWSDLLIWRSVPAAEETLLLRNVLRLAGLSGFAGCLLAACIMDLETKEVYRYVWVTAIIPLAILLRTADKPVSTAEWTELVIFILLQQILFSRMYGRADSHAFCVCAAVFIISGDGFAGGVMHMAVSFLLLCIVQIYKKNVTALGRLKEPVAMLPYITAGFCVYMIIRKWVDFTVRK